MAQADSCIIEIDGQRLRSFSSLTIEQFVGQPDAFELLCMRNALVPRSEIDSSSIASLGSKAGSEITFRIENIHTGSGTKDFYFKGIIREINAERTSQSIEGLQIKGNSPEILLQGHTTRRSFENKTLRQVVEEVLRPYPQDVLALSSSCQTRDTNVYPYIVQYDETNYQFIARLSKEFSEWFFYDGRNLVFGSPRNERIELTYGINLSNLLVGSSIVPIKFHARHYDFLSDREIEADSDTTNISQYLSSQANQPYNASINRYPDSGFYNYHNSFSLQPDPINSVFELRKQRTAFDLFLIDGIGAEPISIGNNLQVYGRTRQSGNEDDLGEYLSFWCKHTISHDLNYTNEFNAFPKHLQIGPSNFQSGINTFIESAIVTDNNDPEKLGRIRVRTGWQDQNQMTPWARVITQHSGDSRGHYFIPEIGDEVLINYEHGDPQKPIVLGSFFGANHGPEQGWVTERNDIKKIRTRSGHTIEFDDTSGSERLVIYNGSGSSTGSNSNKISFDLNPEKITIESQGDIELKGNNIKVDAQGSIDLHAMSGMTIKTDTGNASLEGTQVALKADGQFKAEGSTAEINGSALTKIQGGMVQIN